LQAKNWPTGLGPLAVFAFSAADLQQNVLSLNNSFRVRAIAGGLKRSLYATILAILAASSFANEFLGLLGSSSR
jgi:hypothetical protein